jgi:MFS family permease
MSGPAAPDKKRRLPLLPQAEVVVEGDEDRPPWHWSAVGAVGVFVLWLPLVILVNRPVAGGATPGGVVIALNAAAFALACFTSGFLVGRFGGKAGPREAMVGGAAASATACLIAALQILQGFVTWLVFLAVLVAFGGAAARAGGALGVARRKHG